MRTSVCGCGVPTVTLSNAGPIPKYCPACRVEAGRRDRRNAQARYRVTDKGTATAARYWRTEKGRAASKRNRQKHWDDYREKREAYQADQAQRFPERRRARGLVRFYVRTGRINRPDACQDCGRETRLHGHHHRGYTGEAKLDVVWLCPACHWARHREGVIAA